MTFNEMLEKYPNGVGCYMGDGSEVYETIEEAVDAGCYPNIYSCEVLPEAIRPIPHRHGSALTRREERIMINHFRRGPT